MIKKLKPTFIQWARFIMQFKTMLKYVNNGELNYLNKLIEKEQNKRKEVSKKL